MTQVCKYHGRVCDQPERCEEWHPRKYTVDGALEVIDPDRLVAGCVIRPVNKIMGIPTCAAIPAFSDSTVLRIYVHSYAKNGSYHVETGYDTLAEALAAKTKDDNVYVKVARPYLYADTIGCCVNWLVGVEPYEIQGEGLLETHRAVVQSTGEYAKYGGAK